MPQESASSRSGRATRARWRWSMAPKPCGAGTGASLPRRTRRHRSRTLTAPHAAPSIGAMSTYPVRTRRWTRKEYDRLIDLGILREDEPIELIGGQLIVSEPKTSLHATAVRLTADALRRAFGEGWLVCTQDPIAPDDESEPEPDVIVIPGQIRDYRDAHPEGAALRSEERRVGKECRSRWSPYH